MRKPLVKIVSVVFLVVLASAALVAFSQMADSPQEPLPKLDHIVAPPVAAEETGATEDVIVLSQRDDQQQRAIAQLLQSESQRSARAAYFQWAVSTLNNPRPHVNFEKWRLEIVNVKVVDGKTIANVRAIPIVTGRGGVPAILSAALDETYEFDGAGLKLLKSEPPVNQKGVAFLTF